MTSIGLFTYSTRPRGSVVHAAALAEALTDLGHDVTLYALSKSGDAFYRPLRARLQLLAAREAPPEPDRLIAQRIEEFVTGLRALSPDHAIYHAEDCLAANALLHAGVSPVVRTVHHVERFESPYLLECQRRSIEQADHVLSVSAATRHAVLTEFGREAPSVPNGVDLARFAGPRAPVLARLRDELGVGRDEPVVLSVGGVEPRKNSVRALQAFARVAEARPELHWVVAGGTSIWDHDPYRRGFLEQLAGLEPELQRRIHLVGTVDEDTLTALYQLADVLLFPSTQEGWGLTVLEALAASTAVVVPRAEPFTEYLDDGCAVLVEPSVDAIAAGLASLIADPVRRARLAAAGRVRAARYDWRRSALEHLAQYRALLGAPAHSQRPPLAAATAGD